MPKVTITDTKGLVQETGKGFTVDNNDDDKPGYIALTSANGAVWYLSVGDDGQALVLSSQVPNADESSAGDDYKVTLA
jgi:hypothetical protein